MPPASRDGCNYPDTRKRRGAAERRENWAQTVPRLYIFRRPLLFLVQVEFRRKGKSEEGETVTEQIESEDLARIREKEGNGKESKGLGRVGDCVLAKKESRKFLSINLVSMTRKKFSR